MKTPLCKLKFYADSPEDKNKRFTYSVYDLSHAIDMLNKFVNSGWKIRMAYFETENGKNIALKTILSSVDGDLTGIYSSMVELEKKIDYKKQS